MTLERGRINAAASDTGAEEVRMFSLKGKLRGGRIAFWGLPPGYYFFHEARDL